LLSLVLPEPALQECDGGEEVVVEVKEQVDIVEVFLAREAVD
jgi:predicted CoA-binding protein